jgi:hypothetical protein
VPVLHALVALACVQATPQAPQLLTLWMFVSQPLLTDSSQLSNPGLQVGSQVPVALQLTVALGTLPQLASQPPQSLTVRRSVSQVLLSASQSACVSGHASEVHLPPAQ